LWPTEKWSNCSLNDLKTLPDCLNDKPKTYITLSGVQKSLCGNKVLDEGVVYEATCFAKQLLELT